MRSAEATITYAPLEERPGLLLWSKATKAVPPRLRSAFARGRWVSDVPLLMPDGDDGLTATPVEGWWLPASTAAESLAPITLAEMRRLSAAAKVWVLAAKWVVEALARQQVVPAFGDTDGETWRATWRVAPVRREDRSRLAGLAANMPGAARCFAHVDDMVVTSSTALQRFLDGAADGLLRATTEATMPIAGHGPDWVVRLAGALGGPDDTFVSKGVHDSYLKDGLNRWIAPATNIGEGRPMVGFRLAEPRSANGRWLLSYYLYAPVSGERVAASELERASKKAAAVLDNMVAPHDTLLEALGRCGRVFSPIMKSLNERFPAKVSIAAHDAWDFLTRASLLLERSGYAVEVPAALSRVGKRRVRARMRVGAGQSVEDLQGDRSQGSGLLAGLVNFRWEACLGEDTLSGREFMELTQAKAPLVYHRGEWIAVDPDDVARLRALIDTGEGALSAAEALRLALAGEILMDGDGELRAEVVGDGVVASAMELLKEGGAAEPEDLVPPEGLNGALRHYQSRGFAWLTSVTQTGFGACLADDMGLGKTVQVLTLLLSIAEQTERPIFLVVCPTSVIGNWRREIRRFAPSLTPLIHHGPSRASHGDQLRRRIDRRAKKGPAVLITSYALARRDCDMLQSFLFDALVLDEAQNIKNPDAAQSQAVRLLRTRRRVAMTGTPVENRLTELWSILDFLNPGLLGPRSAFKKQFAVPIERYGDEAAAELLRRVTGPFILRRVKTDPTIAPELPDKSELVRYCPFTREQAALYQATVNQSLEDIRGLEVGMQRRGRILAMITAIKQICNHPAHYLRDGEVSARRSGKLTRFLELMEEVVASDGQALVFTQYREMGFILQRVLGAELGEDVPFLHGALSRTQREQMVANFQSDRGPSALVISLRAGGTGLNLTRANHVFHYDRWWNPAVEDQATDRAFRIGQTRDVTVHRLVSQGTMEEQIHQLLEDKRALAGKVVGTDETWLSELDDDTLQSLMSLGQDAVLEEEA